MAHEIETGVPIPPSRIYKKGGGVKGAIIELAKSLAMSSVFFPAGNRRLRASIRASVSLVRRELGLPKGYFTTRSQDGGIRVWKVGE